MFKYIICEKEKYQLCPGPSFLFSQGDAIYFYDFKCRPNASVIPSSVSAAQTCFTLCFQSSFSYLRIDVQQIWLTQNSWFMSRANNSSRFPRTILVLTLKVLHFRKPLSSGKPRWLVILLIVLNLFLSHVEFFRGIIYPFAPARHSRVILDSSLSKCISILCFRV